MNSRNNNSNKNDRGSKSKSWKGEKRGDKEDRKEEDYYEKYYGGNEIETGMKEGKIISGNIRVVNKFDGKSFLTHPLYNTDICIDNDKLRNRALDGDFVAIELFEKERWNVIGLEGEEAKKHLQSFDPKSLIKMESGKKITFEEDIANLKINDRKDVEKDLLWRSIVDIDDIKIEETGDEPAAIKIQPTGKVVGILKVNHKSDYVGNMIIPSNIKKGSPAPSSLSFIMFKPYDNKCPYIKLPFGVLPVDFLSDPQDHANTLYSVQISKWDEKERSPEGLVRGSLGEAGEIATETQALLAEFDVNHGDFSEDILKDLTDYSDDWSIPEEEIKKRKDLRHLRIFSIDPTTARDLDDSLHITPLENGEFEIGVHIADVSYFIPPGSNLDKEAQRRATTVYLVQMIVPMLPRILCEKLCSLNPGVDRLAFSVIFKMTKDGNLTGEDPWFGRTVIHSCSKLDYDTAQRMITGEIKIGDGEGISKELWDPLRRPVGHSMDQVIQDVLYLQMIAKERRKKRFEGGALQLNRPKLSFVKDEDGNPIDVFKYPIKDSNSLIEEYMLLANYLVAEKMILHAKSKAFLRNHPPPKMEKLNTLLKAAADSKVELNISSAGELQNSLKLLPPHQKRIWEWYAVTCMNQAAYFACASSPPGAWKHYALAIPYYTHFTSPIRRYADCIVHRVLDEILLSENAEESFPSTFDEMSEIAQHCNDKKTASRKAQERSDFIYLCVYLKSKPVKINAICLEVSYARFKILIPEFSYEHMILVNDVCKEGETSFDKTSCTLTLPSYAFADEPKGDNKIAITMLDEVEVYLSADLSKRPTIVVKLLKKI